MWVRADALSEEAFKDIMTYVFARRYGLLSLCAGSRVLSDVTWNITRTPLGDRVVSGLSSLPLAEVYLRRAVVVYFMIFVNVAVVAVAIVVLVLMFVLVVILLLLTSAIAIVNGLEAAEAEMVAAAALHARASVHEPHRCFAPRATFDAPSLKFGLQQWIEAFWGTGTLVAIKGMCCTTAGGAHICVTGWASDDRTFIR